MWGTIKNSVLAGETVQAAQPAEDDFKSSHVWLNVKTEFSFVEQAELVHWHVR